MNFERQVTPSPVEFLGDPPTDVYVTAWVEAGKKPYIFAHPMVGWPLVDLDSIFGVRYSIAASGSHDFVNMEDEGLLVSMWDEQQGQWFIRKTTHKIPIPPNRRVIVRPTHFQDEDCSGFRDHISHQPVRVDSTDPPVAHQSEQQLSSSSSNQTIANHLDDVAGTSSTSVPNKSEPNEDVTVAPIVANSSSNSSSSSSNETSELLVSSDDSDPPVEATTTTNEVEECSAEQKKDHDNPCFWVESQRFDNPLEAVIVRAFHENLSESKRWVEFQWIYDRVSNYFWADSRLAKALLDTSSEVWIQAYYVNQTLEGLIKQGWVVDRDKEVCGKQSYFKGWKLLELEGSNHPKSFSNPIHWIENEYFVDPLEPVIIQLVVSRSIQATPRKLYEALLQSLRENKKMAAAIIDYGVWVDEMTVTKTVNSLTDQGYLAHINGCYIQGKVVKFW